MTAYLGLITSFVSSTVALGIAIMGWRRSDRRATDDYPGHLATILRVRLRLEHTMKGVRLDRASAARLRAYDDHDAGHKWLIFDASRS